MNSICSIPNEIARIFISSETSFRIVVCFPILLEIGACSKFHLSSDYKAGPIINI
jgi:hypothetical protein